MAIIKIHRIFVGVRLDIAPDFYWPYVSTDSKGIKQLITQCINSTYGTMVSSLLYHCKFCKMLKLKKFKINPRDTCVYNQLVNGLQKYILFHVDDCKLSHKDPKVNDSLTGVLHEEYQSILEYLSVTMQVTHGKVHR